MQQQTGTYTSGQYFKGLMVICYALTGGVVMFTLVITGLVFGTHAYGRRALIGDDERLILVFTVVALVISFTSITASFVVYNKKVEAAKAKGSLRAMLDDYRAAVILRYALMEGPALFAIIVFYLTGQFYLLALIAAIIAVMLYSLPNKQKMIDTLELSSQQAGIVNDNDAVIE